MRDGERYLLRRAPEPLAVTVDYLLGSGDHAQSFVSRTPEDKLIELPVTWYARRGGYWEMSPGFDKPAHQGFTRVVNERCMFCHNGYPVGAPAMLKEGIDCERCHGPGDRHAVDARRESIVNSARLTTERAAEVCMQCHLETTSGDLPGAILKPGRTIFSYRPGEPLGDYQTYLDHAPEAGLADKFEIVSSVYRLRQSACYRSDPAKLACTKCHNPHVQQSRIETAIRAGQVCAGCHQDTSHAKNQACVDCHMPLREAEDVPHVEITDHKIGRSYQRVSAAALASAGSARPVVYYPSGAALPNRVADYTTRGQALLASGDVTGAIAAFRESVNARPEIAELHINLAAALIAKKDYAAARQQLEEAIRIKPSVSAFSNLGVLLDLLGDHPAAVAAFRRAVQTDPSSAAARANLEKVLAR